MNAPARIAADPVATFMPWASEAERKLRQRLLRAQALASAKVVSAESGPSRTLLWMITEVAGSWAFAPASADDLRDVADGMVRLLMVAEMFERVENCNAK